MTLNQNFFFKLHQSYQQHPLFWILSIGLLARVFASFFGGGYIASDDHFLVIHIAWRWLNGYTNWLGDDVNRFGHSLIYPSIHLLLLKWFHWIGLNDTSWQMVIVRLFHAFWSLPVLYLGYQFTKEKVSQTAANTVGWLLAILWIQPILSVRQLGEVVSMVPLLYSLIRLERHFTHSNWKQWFLAGWWLGFAFCLRYQAGFAGIGVFAALLLLKQPKVAFYYTLGAIVGTFPVGIIDWIMYGYPYANPIWYFQYNSSSAMYEYITGPWYKYLLLILGVFIFPFSLFLLIGFLRSIKVAPFLFSGTFAFLLIHSIIPNKQERFIATILPELVILGIIGMYQLLEKIQYPMIQRWYRISYRIFWVLNIPLLILTIFTYNKHAEIQSLCYLQKHTEIGGIVLDQRTKPFLAPWYYLGKAWRPDLWLVEVKNEQDFQDLLTYIQTKQKRPDYVIIYQDFQLEQKRKAWERVLGPMQFEKKIGPSLGDWILHQLNPKYNPSITANIFRVKSE
ncbi:MAG: glycosyltransferase family 39 protein [bacterium]|nr:glycosyltransferase family 39 protein [bacterium]